MSLAVLTLNAAYIAFVATAYTRTLAWLRVLLIAGSALLVVYGTVEQVWPIVGWNALIIVTHVIRIVSDRRAQRAVHLTPEQISIRDQFFPDASDFDFHVLWSMGEAAVFSDEIFITDGSRPQAVYVLLDGDVAVSKDGDLVRQVPKGSLIGELSFVSGNPAAVDVAAVGTAHLREWDQQQLAALDQTHPPSAKAFRAMVTRDLVRKAYTN